MNSNFDANYYATSCGRPYQRDEQWLQFFGMIAEKIKREIAPVTVLDAGCAFGFLVEQLRNARLQAYGVDISTYAIEQVHSSIQEFCWVGSLTEPLPHQYDLIVSIEVLEHMPKDQAEKAIQNLCMASDDILISSTPFDYKEATHWNVQVPEYWAEQFAMHAFFRDVDFDASFITPWAVRFRKRKEPVWHVIREYERILWPLKKENFDLRVLASETQNALREATKTIAALQTEMEQKQINSINPELFTSLQQELAASLQQLQSIQAENEAIKNSETWRILQKISQFRQKFRRK